MARTKQTARGYPRPLETWTRFYLPLEQELPTWPVDHVNVHLGPLADVSGVRSVSLGRMVESPEQAAYIIDHPEWAPLDHLRIFQASPTYAEFLRNFPEHRNSRVSIESGAALGNLTMDDAPSRFLRFERATQTPASRMKGRVTITTFVDHTKSTMCIRCFVIPLRVCLMTRSPMALGGLCSSGRIRRRWDIR